MYILMISFACFKMIIGTLFTSGSQSDLLELNIESFMCDFVFQFVEKEPFVDHKMTGIFQHPKFDLHSSLLHWILHDSSSKANLNLDQSFYM